MLWKVNKICMDYLRRKKKNKTIYELPVPVKSILLIEFWIIHCWFSGMTV